MKGKHTAASRRSTSLWLTGAALLVVFALYFFLSPQSPLNRREESFYENPLKVHFIDIGQGDSTLIQTPSGENVLIDAGPGSEKDTLRAYLGASGIDTIELLVFTHPHEDHIGGGEMVLSLCKVKEVLLPDYTTNTAVFKRLLDAIETEGCTVTQAVPHDSFTIDSVLFSVLGPIQSDYEDLNNASAVLRMQYGTVSFLLTGDAEKKAEQDILQSFSDAPLHSDVLKVGHHGSSTSSHDAFLEAVCPEYAVISCAYQNEYGHPNEKTLQRLRGIHAKILRTDQNGTVVFETNGSSLRCRAERSVNTLFANH